MPAAALGLGFFVLYVITLCPTVFWYDSAEYVATAVTLGIPHPPGYPLYTLLAHLFTWLPFEPAYAVNLFSAVSAAITVTLVYYTILRLSNHTWGAIVGACTLGAGQVFWSQAVVAEVYAPALAVIFGVLLLLLKGWSEKRPIYFPIAAGLAGLGLGLHLFIATLGLGFAVLVWTGTPGTLLRRKIPVALSCLAATGLGGLIFLYVLFRARANPPINFENPATWERFFWFVSGGNYGMFFEHDQSLLERAIQIGSMYYDELMPVGLLLAIGGTVALVRRHASLGIAILLMIAGNELFFFNYTVHDAEVFFLPSIALCCVLIGCGVAWVMTWLRDITKASGRQRLLAALVTTGIVALPCSLALANYNKVNLRGYTAAFSYGQRLSDELPPQTIIYNFTTPREWKNYAVFALYFQIVRGARPDVTVEPMYLRPEVFAPAIEQALALGKPVFLFYPVPIVAEYFQIEPAGAAFRVMPSTRNAGL